MKNQCSTVIETANIITSGIQWKLRATISVIIFHFRMLSFKIPVLAKTHVMHLNSCLSHLSTTAYSEVMKLCCTCYFQRSHLLYDRKGEEHYNIISAMHKSIRASDDNAALYWVARMLKGGEDPLYIARRLVRAASEDIGKFVQCVTRNGF